MWNGNEDEEGLKEGIEKDEVIEDIRVNGGHFVGTEKNKWKMFEGRRFWRMNGRNRWERLLSPLKTSESREVSLLEYKVRMEGID